jgi:flagellar biosynthetic protein FliR
MKGFQTISLLESLWPYGLSLSRWLSFLFILPGFGEVFITQRVRLLLALGLSACLTPLMVEHQVLQASMDIRLLLQEVFVGFLLGLLIRLMVEAASSVGGMISHEVALGNITGSFFHGENQDLLQTFFRLYFITFIFVTDLHLIFLQGLCKSYLFFPPGGDLFMEDLMLTAVSFFSQGFYLALQMSAPFMIGGICYYVLLGLMNRLVPQIPVFFVGRPLEIGLGFLMISLSLMAMTTTFHQTIFDAVSGFLE